MIVVYLSGLFVMWFVIFPGTDRGGTTIFVFSFITVVLIIVFLWVCCTFLSNIAEECKAHASMYSLDVFGEPDENTPLV
jgi:hypothetical protein